MSIDELKGSYSPMECTIFGVLRKQEAVTTDMLLRKVYPHKNEEPFNAGIVINRAVTTLGEKLKRNREVYRLERKRRPPGRLIENRLKKIRETA
jgi:hypothetical protein